MNVGIEGVIQGDLMYTKSTVKTETIHGERLYTFRPNTITYGIPVDHEIGKKNKIITNWSCVSYTLHRRTKRI